MIHPVNDGYIGKTAEKPRLLFFRAEDETRTRDFLLGKQILYQVSYFRLYDHKHQ